MPPRSLASATARSTAARWPATTICWGEFTFATPTMSPCAASAHTRSTSVRSSPMIAAIAPVPTGTACCISSPRLRTMRTASANRRARATASAEYSPRLWPAASVGSSPRSAHAAEAATDAVRTAGWVLAVSARSASGPSNMSRARSKPSASFASSKTALALADVV